MMKKCTALLLVLGLMVPGRMTRAQNTPAAAEGAPGGPGYSEGQLEQLVAPIALYPDSLVSQILIASTYPVEVVQAYQWMQKNKSLTGKQAEAAAQSQGWDPSVQSLVQFPQVIDRMFTNLDWTQNLGEAFLAQQQDVLSTIQAMRQKAYAAGNLKSTAKQKVVVQENTTIVIVPAQPQVVYVPSYNPTVVYGAVWAPAVWYYPPAVYAPWPGYNAAAGAMAFGVGVAVGATWSSASNCSWSTGSVTVNNNYYRPPATHYSTQAGSYQGANGSVAHAGNTTAAYNANTGEVKSYNSATGNTRSGEVTQGARGTAVQGNNGSVAKAGNTTAAYNKNTGQVNSYNSATGNTRSGQVNQGANGTAVQGNNGSAAKAGNTTAAYNKNTGQAAAYNSATGQTKSGNVNKAGSSSNWQHDSAQRQGQPYSNSSLNKQYGGSAQNSAAARGYGGGGGSGQQAAGAGGGGRAESAASSRGQASRGAMGSGGGGGGGASRGGGGSRGGGRR